MGILYQRGAAANLARQSAKQSKGRRRRISRFYKLQTFEKGRKPWLGIEVVCSLSGQFSATKVNATSAIFQAPTGGSEVLEIQIRYCLRIQYSDDSMFPAAVRSRVGINYMSDDQILESGLYERNCSCLRLLFSFYLITLRYHLRESEYQLSLIEHNVWLAKKKKEREEEKRGKHRIINEQRHWSDSRTQLCTLRVTIALFTVTLAYTLNSCRRKLSLEQKRKEKMEKKGAEHLRIVLCSTVDLSLLRTTIVSWYFLSCLVSSCQCIYGSMYHRSTSMHLSLKVTLLRPSLRVSLNAEGDALFRTYLGRDILEALMNIVS